MTLWKKLLSCRRCQIVAIAAVVILGLGILFYVKPEIIESVKTAITGDYSKDFEAFWQTAGREESRNRLDSFLGNDAGSGASVGWLHFNQKYSLPDLFIAANEIDSSALRTQLGTHYDNLLNRNWVRSANLSEESVQAAIVRFLGSSLGEKAQKKVAYDQYWAPTLAYLATDKPGADATYRVVVAATRVWTAEAFGEPVKHSSNADDYVRYIANHPIRKDPSGDIWKWRGPRTLTNAKSMLENGVLANK